MTMLTGEGIILQIRMHNHVYIGHMRVDAAWD